MFFTKNKFGTLMKLKELIVEIEKLELIEMGRKLMD